jgi:hypothetical protein
MSDLKFTTAGDYMFDMASFVEKAQQGPVTVEFRKVGTDEVRVMPCTLNSELSGGAVPAVLEQREAQQHLAVWCLDKSAWRSFRGDTVVTWYEGFPVNTI